MPHRKLYQIYLVILLMYSLSFTTWYFLVSLTLRQDGDYYCFHQIANPFRCWIKLSMSCQRNTHYQRQSHCVKSLDILFLRWDWILCVAFLDVRLHLWPCELVKAIIDSQNNLSIGTDNVYNYISRYWMHLLLHHNLWLSISFSLS